MSAVLHEEPDDASPDEQPDDASPEALTSKGSRTGASPNVASGLKPIERLTSDDRLARINPETLAKTELLYCSKFAREFIRSDYNFCAAKMTIARGGKLAALDMEFRVAESWFKKAAAWMSTKHGRDVGIEREAVTLEIKHPLSGRLVRLVTLYDLLFLKTLEGLMAMSISPHERRVTLDSAEARIRAIPYLCIPDANNFAPEGKLLFHPSSDD